MPVDEDLLAAAKMAGDRFASAEREADLARTHYHHAVRRLHLAGASVRDVAHAIGLSHQRVQQIVQANGGTWWSSIWRGRRIKPDMLCSFCGRPSAQVAKLIAGPKVYICDACVGTGEQVLRGATPTETAGGGQMELLTVGSRVRCSFCRRKSTHAVTKLKRVYDRDIDDIADYAVTHADKADSRLELRIVRSGDKNVCNKCLEICRRILDDRSGIGDRGPGI
jgi:hypothetical protein